VAAVGVDDVDLAVVFDAAPAEDLDAHVVREDLVRARSVKFILEVDLPEDPLGVGVFFDHRRFERDVLRVYWLPGLNLSLRRSGEEDQVNEEAGRGGQGGDNRVADFHSGVLLLNRGSTARERGNHDRSGM